MESKKINVITLFSGYDSQCMALDRLGIDYNLSAWAEIDKNAINAHNVVYPQWADRNVGDVSKVDWTTITEPIDLLTYSSPCFVAGTLILTKRGYIPIEDVVIGDEVLTHANEYKKVLRIGGKESSDIYHINGMMFDGITCTGNHPFYVREMYRYGHKSVRMFKDAEWLEAGKLTKKHYLGYAINTESKYPEWSGVIDNRWGHGRTQNTLSDLFSKREFWYLMGRYVGDGWKKHSAMGNGIIICCSERNEESLIGCLEALGFKYHKDRCRTVTKITLCGNELYEFVGRYGYYAHGKVVDPETIDLPVEMLKGFLDGVVDSDGCYTNNEYKISSVSKTLVYGLTQCIAKVYHTHVKMGFCQRKKTTIIEGRNVNQRDTYSISWHPDERKQDHAFFEDGRVWFPISKITKAEETHHVYNLEVEGDNSYTANGAIVHNCQDFSNAGLQRGGEQGSGTRSSLLWEVERAIETLHPKYLLLENVAALVGKKFLPLFKKWCDVLEGYGYSNTWQVMNAKDYGVPQNRKRVFLVSKLNDNTPYYFPKPFKLEKRLKDVLEDNVPDTFYLSEDRIKGVVESMRKQREKGNGFAFRPKTEDDDVANSVTTGAGSRKTDNFIAEGGIVNVGQLSGSQNSRIIDPEGISHTITNGEKDGIPKIIANTAGFGTCYVSDVCPTIKSSSWNYNNALVEGVEKVGDLDPEHKWQGKVTHPHNLMVGTNGISPTILSTHDRHPFKVAEDPRIEVVGDLNPDNQWQGVTRQQNIVVADTGLSPCLNASHYKHEFSILESEKDNQDDPRIEKVGSVKPESSHGGYAVVSDKGICPCLTATHYEHELHITESDTEPKVQCVGSLRPDNLWQGTPHYQDRVYSPEGISPTVTTAQGGNMDPKIVEGVSPTETKVIEDFYANRPPREYTEVAPTLRSEEKTILNACADGTASALRSEGLRGSDKCITDPKGGFGKMGVMEEYPEETIRIRRLTPRELYRLMDVDEKNIDKLLASDIARTQHSKLAGNSIVVSCLYYIFKNLFEDVKEGPAEGEQLKLF